MANQGGIRAGLAFVELYAKDNELVKGLNAAQAKLKGFGNALKAVGIGLGAAGAGIIAPILASARAFASNGAALEHMSQRTGFAVETLSELAGAAELTGTSIDDVEVSVKHMQKTIFAATQQSEEAAQALAYLSLTADKLRGLKPEAQFEMIAEKLAGIQDPTRKAAIALQIMGKSGTAILPLIENMKAARIEARQMGAIMSKEDVEAATTLSHVFHLMKLSLDGIVNAIGSAVAPVLTEYITLAGRTIAAVSSWIRKHKDLVVTALQVGTTLVAAGAAVLGVGLALITAGQICGAVAVLISTGFSLAAAAGGALAAVIGAIATPVGILFVALSAIFGALIYFSGLLGEATDAAQQAFNSMKSFALDCFSGIKDALMAGDIELAATILWTSLKVVWQTGTNWLYDIWIGFSRLFLTAVDLVAGGIMRAFDAAAVFVYKTWNTLVGWFTKKVGEISGAIQNALAYFGIGQGVNVDAQNSRIDAHTNADNAKADQGLEQRDAAFKQQIGMDQRYGQSGLDQNESDLAKTKQDLQGLIFQAHQEAMNAAAPQQKKQLEAITPEMDKIMKGTAIGTFNSSSVGQLGIGNSVNERIAKAAERTAAAAEETATNTKGGGIVAG